MFTIHDVVIESQNATKDKENPYMVEAQWNKGQRWEMSQQ